jgi:NADPH:quinone reductase
MVQLVKVQLLMKAIQIRQFKEAADLNPREVETPGPMAEEVIVKVSYAAINPSDIKNFRGMMPQTKLPRIIGRDFAGTIVEGPKNRIGEKVWGTGGDLGIGRDGAHAEFVRLPEVAAVTLPSYLNPAQAATLGVPFTTAMSVLDCLGEDLKGKTLLIVGGTGAVGTATTLIARARGADVIRTTRTDREIEEMSPALREGKYIFLDKTPDIQPAVRDLTKNEGVHFALNMVGGTTFEPTLNSLREFGKLVAISSVPDHRVGFNLLQFYHKQLTLFGVNTLLLDFAQCGSLLKRMVKEVGPELNQLEDAQLRSLLRPFKDAKSAYEDMMSEKLRKAVLVMSD